MLSTCSTDFSQQIAQAVLFLFLGRPCLLMRTGDRALHLQGCVCRKVAEMTILQGLFLRTVRLKESLMMKVSMKELFLYAVILVPVNLNLMVKNKVTIIRNL
jgi:hypothetical protein